MKLQMKQILISILVFLGAASLAYASEGPESECLTEISRAELLINTQGADLVSSQGAKKATKICTTEFSRPELRYFKDLSSSCDLSFAHNEGTAASALHSFCHMNAARFVMSLQMNHLVQH